MSALTKINKALRANPVLYMATSAMIALTIQFIGLELHKRAQAAKERKALEAAGKSAEADQALALSASTGGTQLRPSR